MQSVYLRFPSNEYYVSEEGFEAVSQLVKQYQLCQKGYHAFSHDNPCVGRNLCLQHLLLKHSDLTFLDVVRTDVSGRRIYRYIDPAGYLYTSTEDSSDDVSQQLGETLLYHGFGVPETVTYREKTVAFNEYYATLYGDLNNACVVVLSFDKRSSETVKGLFLLSNDGSYQELTKRGEQKHLFTRAQELLAATKDERGTYHLPNGSTTTVLTDEDCYPIISQLESAVVSVIRQLSPKHEPAVAVSHEEISA